MIEESNASVALEEEAASTSAASPTATEGATAKDGEKPGETPPVEGKSSQDKSPSTDESEDLKDGVVNPHAYRRIKEERNDLRTKMQGLSELGIKSKEDAELLLKDAEISEAEAETKGRTNLVRWMIEDPVAFGEDLHKNHPKVYQVFAERSAAQALHARSQELQESNPELAAELLELARVYHGEGKANGSRAPKAPDANTRELTTVREEKQQVFEEQASAENTAAVRIQFDELTKGIAFISPRQKSRFFRNVIEGVQDALERNPTFTRQMDRLSDVRNLSREQIRQRRVQVAELHKKHAADPALLKRLIAAEREDLGLRLTDPPPNGKSRTEVNGSGTPPSGQLTQSDYDRKYAELQEKYDGRMLAMKWGEWKHAN